MIPRIKNNFFRASGTGTSWKFEIDKLPSHFDNYFIESCHAAQEIYDLRDGPLHVLYSGGIDSEYTLNVFLSMGIPVVPVIVRLLPNYNDHDTEYAFKFCQTKNIKPFVINIDFDNFVKSGKLDDIQTIAKSSYIIRAFICHAIGLIDGSVICSEGDPHTIKDENTGEWYFTAAEDDYSIENYMINKNIDGTSFFCGYTPEMLSSFLVDPRMKDLADNKILGKLGNKSSKYIIYNRHTPFNIEERPKYHGFENIFNSEISTHPNLAKYLPITTEYNGTYKIKYYDLIKGLI